MDGWLAQWSRDLRLQSTQCYSKIDCFLRVTLSNTPWWAALIIFLRDVNCHNEDDYCDDDGDGCDDGVDNVDDQLLTRYLLLWEVHRPHSWGMGAACGQRLISSYSARSTEKTAPVQAVQCKNCPREKPTVRAHSIIFLIEARASCTAQCWHRSRWGLRVNVRRLSQAPGLWIRMLLQRWGPEELLFNI